MLVAICAYFISLRLTFIRCDMQTSLSLGHVPPVITSVSFNENGNILAAGATDGMILIFGTFLHNENEFAT